MDIGSLSYEAPKCPLPPHPTSSPILLFTWFTQLLPIYKYQHTNFDNLLGVVRVLSTGGGAGGKLPPQTPKLSPQNLVTDHGIQEILGLSNIKSDLKTPQNQKISWGILPQTPYTMCTSVVSYYIHCIVRCFPPRSTFLDRTLMLMELMEHESLGATIFCCIQ